LFVLSVGLAMVTATVFNSGFVLAKDDSSDSGGSGGDKGGSNDSRGGGAQRDPMAVEAVAHIV
jgi:hypothetical protein